MKYLGIKGLLAASVLVWAQMGYAVTATDRAIEENNLRNQREAVSTANQEYQDAVHRYGLKSPQVKTAESKLLDARQDLDRSLSSQNTQGTNFGTQAPMTPAPGVSPMNPGTGNPPPGAPATR